jgi:hypothetical protein
MAIYRPASRRPLLIVGGLALVAGLVLGFVTGQATAPGVGAVLDGLRDRVATVASALEVLRVEYPELLEGADPGGAEQALARAQANFTALEPDLALIDADAVDQAYRSLQEVQRRVTARVPAAQLDAAIDEVLARLETILPSGGAQ